MKSKKKTRTDNNRLKTQKVWANLSSINLIKLSTSLNLHKSKVIVLHESYFEFVSGVKELLNSTRRIILPIHRGKIYKIGVLTKEKKFFIGPETN